MVSKELYFLNGRVEFDQGRMVEFENGVITSNNIEDFISFRFTYTLNLRPVYELKFKGNFINKPSEVTVWRNSNMPIPSLPNEYVIWDASVNGVQFAQLHYIALPSTGSVSKNAYPKSIPPAPVSGINIVEESGDVVLTWAPNIEPDMARYKIFRAPADTSYLTAQIASLPAHITEYRDRERMVNDHVYKIVAYDSTGNMSMQFDDNKIYSFVGAGTSRSDTLRVTPAGITVQISNPDYRHGAMVTVRNRGYNDSLVVEWYGGINQNSPTCMSRMAELFGNGAQINNFTSPKLSNGTVLINLRSATRETYLVDIEIFDWANGPGCQ